MTRRRMLLCCLVGAMCAAPAVAFWGPRIGLARARRPLAGLRPRMSADAMEQVITKIRSAPNEDELALIVSKSVKTVAQPAFFLRLAELSDQAQDPVEKYRLQKLAKAVQDVLQRLMEFAEKKMDDSSSLVQIVVSTAAEQDGEFLVPLSDERLVAVRQSIRIHRDALDNNFLTTVQAWMDKSRQGGLDGMITILQKVLQIYAAEAVLQRGGAGDEGKAQGKTDTPANALLDELLTTDADNWAPLLVQKLHGGGPVTKDGLMGAVQVAIETVVLAQESGSMAQRVQAEFLSELVSIIDKVAPDTPEGLP